MLFAPRRIDGPDWLTRLLRKLGIDGPDWGSRGGAISPTDSRVQIIGPVDRPAGLGEQVLSITSTDGGAGPQLFNVTGPYSYRAADGRIVSCWYSPATGWFCPNAAPVANYPWWAWGGGYGRRPGNWYSGSGGDNWGGHHHVYAGPGQRGFGHHGNHGLGATDEEQGAAVRAAAVENQPAHAARQAWIREWSWLWPTLSLIGAVTGAYHGYKRNNSIGWAIGWGILGGAFPFATIPISFAQGFGKSRKANRRRRNAGVKLKPGQRWQRFSGELWKACTECAAPMGPFQHNLDGPDVCQRCEEAPTGQYPAARRANRKEQRAYYYYYARGFTAGRRGGPLSIWPGLTASQTQAAKDGYAAGRSAPPAIEATAIAGRRANSRRRRRRNGPTRARLAEVANAAAGGSRRGGAGGLTASSSRKDVIDWLQWNDPNGSHTDARAAREDVDPYTLDEAWDALAVMLEDDMDFYA